MSKGAKNDSQETTVEQYSPPQINDTDVLTQEYGAEPKTTRSGLRRTDTQAIDPYGSRPSNTTLSPSSVTAESKSNRR
jgi:hypothetical protein